ncbi:C-14 sterol reductase [Purpureocillium lavendulum]|uniref:C-14 sterol reductase n=1 Tax=Purpureocillium lavendulum TaxID=1247861 RepID=A0AB34G048_9HYPO|nr:C-14 sterol reductase [Purpureocillium lavendulum]
MSGFEIAGIVLGSLPLLISAIEHYGDGISTIQRWRRYQRELRSLTRNLETERVKLQNVCEKLLVGIVPPSRIELMINEPMGSCWREDETQKKVRVRLWKGFEAFEATIGDVQTAVEEMNRRIASQCGPNASEIKRAVFTLSRSQYADLLSTIRDGISNLENLTDRNMELEPARRLRSQGKFFMLLREMSKSVYRALGFSLDCSCTHDVGLRLERRTANFIPTDNDEKIMSDTAFKLALSYDSSPEYPEIAAWDENARIWEEIRVKAAPIPEKRSHPCEPPICPGAVWPKLSKGKKTVAFAHLSRASGTTSATATVVRTEVSQGDMKSLHTSISSLTMGMGSIELVSFGTTMKLCQRIKIPKDGKTESYGVIIDHESQTRRSYAVYPVHQTLGYEQIRLRPRSLISFRQVLDQKIHLPYRDRLQLAVTISSSVLQLHGSPWLRSTISSRDIFFIKVQDYPVWSHPLVIKQFRPVSPSDERLSGEAAVGSGFCNSTLFSLGILLIEIILGKTFDSLRTSDEGSLSTSFAPVLADYITAQRIVDQNIRMASANYGTAVTRLIGQSPGLDSADFCQEIYSGVVALLEKDLAYT